MDGTHGRSLPEEKQVYVGYQPEAVWSCGQLKRDVCKDTASVNSYHH